MPVAAWVRTSAVLASAVAAALAGCGGSPPDDDSADVVDWADPPVACEDQGEMRVPIDGGPHDGDAGPTDPHEEVLGEDPIPVHVNLGFRGDPWSSAGITWETDRGTRSSLVEIRTDDDGPIRIAGRTYELDNVGGDPDVSRLHEAWLCNLRPATSYTYRVGGPGAWSGELRFTTAPEPSAAPEPLRFAVLGDSNFGYTTWADVIASVATHDPDFIVHTGDVLHGGNSQLEWMAWFAGAEGVLGATPLLVAHGNHDELARLYFGHLVLPGNEELYSVDWAGAHLVVLNDSERDDEFIQGEARDFLEEDLARSVGDWTFLFHHRPPYCSHDGGNTTVRDAWGPLVDDYHVDVVFNGHWHLYERTVPIRDGQEALSSADGTTYVITGGAGAAGYECGEAWFSDVCEETFNYVIVDIDGGDLVLTAYRSDGSVLDEMEIHKDVGARR